jgi:hypothetical protein
MQPSLGTCLARPQRRCSLHINTGKQRPGSEQEPDGVHSRKAYTVATSNNTVAVSSHSSTHQQHGLFSPFSALICQQRIQQRVPSACRRQHHAGCNCCPLACKTKASNCNACHTPAASRGSTACQLAGNNTHTHTGHAVGVGCSTMFRQIEVDTDTHF